MVKNRNKVKKPAKKTKSNSTLKTVIDFLLSENFHIGLTFLLALIILVILILTYFNNDPENYSAENFKLPKHYMPLKNSEEIEENYEETSSPNTWLIPTTYSLFGLAFVLLFIKSCGKPLPFLTLLTIGYVIYSCYALFKTGIGIVIPTVVSVVLLLSLVSKYLYNTIKQTKCSKEVQNVRGNVVDEA